MANKFKDENERMGCMRRVEVLVIGDVQRVGFRDVVQKTARKLGICGTVQNQEPYDVKIVAEGEKDHLDEFLGYLRLQKHPILVEDLVVQWMDATGEFPYFKILRGDWQEEMGERFDVASGMLSENIELSKQMLKKQDKTIELQIEMIKRQDKMLDMQIEMIKRQDKMLDMQQDTIDRQEETVVEIRGMRSDLHDHLDRRFARIEDEIGEIKRAIKEMGGSCS